MGIKEKKEIRNLTEFMDNEGLPTLRAACENSDLSYAVDLDDSLDAEKIRISIFNVKEFVEGFSSVCEDADYKEEIQKVSQITIRVVPCVERTHNLDANGNLALNGAKLTIELDGVSSLSNGASGTVPKLIRALY